MLVVLATYNERETLPSLVDAIFAELPQAEVLVIDDASPDGTGAWCDQRAARDQRLQVLHRPGKLGLGSATITGLKHAIAAGHDVVATLDADWSHDPKRLSELVATLDKADVAIGSRYCSGGRIEGWPFSRHLVSGVMNRASRWLLGLPVADSSGAFRAYRVAMLQDIDLDAIDATGYAYLEEILCVLADADATFAEVPIVFRERRAGRSKAGLGELCGKLAMLRRLAGRRARET